MATEAEVRALIVELLNICDTEMLGQNSIEENRVRDAVRVIETLMAPTAPVKCEETVNNYPTRTYWVEQTFRDLRTLRLRSLEL